jgi:hypothetical protein
MTFLLEKKNQEERGSVGIIGEGNQRQVYYKLCIKLEYPDHFRKYYRTNANRSTFELAYILNNIETYLQA